MNFFNYKSCKNKEADIGKKGKLKKKLNSHTENYNNYLYFFQNFPYKKVTWHINTTLI